VARKNSLAKQIWRRLRKNRLAFGCFVILALIIIAAIAAPWILPYGYAKQNMAEALQPPSFKHIFGTDNFGRDLFSRILYGSRYTLVIGFGCATVSAILGIIVGVLAGSNKKVDMLLMRVVDIMMGIPSFTLNLCLVIAMGKNLASLMCAISITHIPVFARIVRVQVMTVSSQEYIEAAVSVGAQKLWIVMKHILPNSYAPIIVLFTFQVVGMVMTAASLSFIGMGIQPPEPEWGVMISAGRTYLRSQWHMAIMPGIALIVITYALNLLGDGLRDALDPRLKQ